MQSWCLILLKTALFFPKLIFQLNCYIRNLYSNIIRAFSLMTCISKFMFCPNYSSSCSAYFPIIDTYPTHPILMFSLDYILLYLLHTFAFSSEGTTKIQNKQKWSYWVYFIKTILQLISKIHFTVYLWLNRSAGIYVM